MSVSKPSLHNVAFLLSMVVVFFHRACGFGIEILRYPGFVHGDRVVIRYGFLAFLLPISSYRQYFNQVSISPNCFQGLLTLTPAAVPGC